jgi:hypothetical protein
MEINHFDYRDRPFTQEKKHQVYILSDEGFNQYLGNDSYVHNYVSRLNPRALKEIFAKKAQNETTRKWKEETSCKQTNIVKNEDKLNKTQTINENNNNFINSYNDRAPIENEYKVNVDNNHQDNNNRKTNLRNEFLGSKEFGRTFSNFKHTKKTPLLKTNNIDNKRYPQVDVERSFSYLNNNNKNLTSSNFFKQTKKYDGFESYNVPRLDKKNITMVKPLQRNESAYVNRYVTKIDQAVTTSKKDELSRSALITIDDKIIAENQKLRTILKNQLDKGFLNEAKLPKISYIISQPELILRKTGIGNSKYMGEKYNPMNYIDNSTKKQAKRNYHGSLYQR